MLTPEQVAQYQEYGYAVGRAFLSPSEVKDFVADIEMISATATVASHDRSRMEMEPNQGPEGKLVRRIYDPCTNYPQFRSLSESRHLLDVIEQLVGPNIVFHLSKINMKPPELGSVVEWHQDLAYYPLTNFDSVTVLFYLDDTDSANGCLQVIPGGHRQGLLDHTFNGVFQGRVTEPMDASQSVFLEGPAGTAIFMHGMAPHSSAPNKSARARRTLIISYRAADAFPIYVGPTTQDTEAHVRLVRGELLLNARFGMKSFPIPRFPRKTKSLYELQELSRKEFEARG
jgi:ectoine hydroxylase-related dioxygenase (phytanoyl-CoA dioxygenase family)